MSFFREHKALCGVLAAVLVLIVLMSVSSVRARSDEGNDSAAERAAQSAAATVDEPVMKMSDRAASFFGGLFHARRYQKENEELKEEIRSLREQLNEAQLEQSELERLEELSIELNYLDPDSSFQRITADVISIDESGVVGVLTVGAGSDDGVEKGDIVICGDGLCGRVISTASRSCKILGVIDSSNAVSFCLERDPDTIGLVSGDQSGGLSGYLFDGTRSVGEGDVLITSGLGRYPWGIRIGTVTAADDHNGTGKVTLEAQSSVDFYTVKTVTILT